MVQLQIIAHKKCPHFVYRGIKHLREAATCLGAETTLNSCGHCLQEGRICHVRATRVIK